MIAFLTIWHQILSAAVSYPDELLSGNLFNHNNQLIEIDLEMQFFKKLG